MKSKKFILVISLLLILIFTYFFLLPESNEENTTSQQVDKVIPEEFINNYLKKTNDFEVKFLGTFYLGTDYKLEKYSLCCEEFSFNNFGKKAVGYFTSNKMGLFFASGIGEIFYMSNMEDSFELKNVKSNFLDLNKNNFLYLPSHDSVKDVLIINDKILLSFVNEKTEDCANVEIVIAEVNTNYLNFDYLLSYDECVSRNHPRFNSAGAGGKLSRVDNDNILVTIGDFTTYENAQSDNSYFGKILKINLENKSVKLISKGHRNPQGLTESYEDGFYVSTEHGPRGGDEINIIDLNTYNNYGWPLSSKGEHYKQQDYEIYSDLAPLNFSHKDFGFVEPIHYFPYHLVGAHGISDIEKNNLKFDESFFVATLNGRVIYEIKINNESQNIEFLNTFKVSERIRDIEYVSNLNKYVILFEETPAIGILSLKD